MNSPSSTSWSWCSASRSFSPGYLTFQAFDLGGSRVGRGTGFAQYGQAALEHTDRNHPTPLGPPLSGYNSRVTDIAFSPDGHTLATSGNGLRQWNVSDPAHPAAIGQPFAVNALELDSLAFTPDSKTLAFGGADGTVGLWPLETDQTIRQICANTDTPSRPQWQKYLSALPYRPTCT